MKWREVKVLCAGMCVCTVIASCNAALDAKNKKKIDLPQRIETTDSLETENMPVAEIE